MSKTLRSDVSLEYFQDRVVLTIFDPSGVEYLDVETSDGKRVHSFTNMTHDFSKPLEGIVAECGQLIAIRPSLVNTRAVGAMLYHIFPSHT